MPSGSFCAGRERRREISLRKRRAMGRRSRSALNDGWAGGSSGAGAARKTGVRSNSLMMRLLILTMAQSYPGCHKSIGEPVAGLSASSGCKVLKADS